MPMRVASTRTLGVNKNATTIPTIAAIQLGFIVANQLRFMYDTPTSSLYTSVVLNHGSPSTPDTRLSSPEERF